MVTSDEDNDKEIEETASPFSPFSVTLDPAGNVFISNRTGGISKVDASSGIFTTPVVVNFPTSSAVDNKSNIYFTASDTSCVNKLDATSGQTTTVAGTEQAGYSGDGGPAINARLNSPSGLLVDTVGTLFIADTGNHCIRKVTADGTISTLAGTGTAGYGGDGGPATQAQLNSPQDVALDADGTLYIADTKNNRIRKVDSEGLISLVAGTGSTGTSSSLGNGGPAINADLAMPCSVALDSKGSVFIADTGHDLVRKVEVSTEFITNIAGQYPLENLKGKNQNNVVDFIPATKAQFYSPTSLAIDEKDNIYIADQRNSLVRKIMSDSDIIVTVAGYGDGNAGADTNTPPDGAPATNLLVEPKGVTRDAFGNLWVVESVNNRIKLIEAITGKVSVVAGTGLAGYSGDGGLATEALLNNPTSLCFDESLNIYIADTGNNCLRRIDAQTGIISSIKTQV